MRAILSKVVVISMIAGAGVLVSACQPATTTVNNTSETVVTENTMDTMAGPDAATGNGTVVENATTTTTNSTTTNAM